MRPWLHLNKGGQLVRTDGKATLLLQQLGREGYFDGLPKHLRQRFIREVMMALPWMRNELGGHGQGEEVTETPQPYAELAVDLAAAFGHFLISLKLDRDGPPATVPPEDSSSDYTVSTSRDVAVAADDDIPF